MSGRRAIVAPAWAIAAGAALVAGVVLRGGPLGSTLGPAVLPWLWAPFSFAAVAAVAAERDRRRLGAGLALAARLAVWLLLARWLTDPAPNGPDLLVNAVTAAVVNLRAAVVGLAGLLVIGSLVALFMGSGGPPSDQRRTAVSTGSALGPVSAALIRGGLRGALWILASLLRVVVLLVIWTCVGLHGLRAISDRTADGAIPSALGRLLGGIGGGSALLGRWFASASAGWGDRTELGVWLHAAALARAETGEISEEVGWPAHERESPDETALRELAEGLVAAYDVALSNPTRGQASREPGHDPRGPAPRLVPYRIEIARAWTRPAYHALVVRITPAAAATAAARLGVDVLGPALDAATSLTASDLRRLRLSDGRVAADPLRAGAAGLFVALDRVVPADGALGGPADPLAAAVTRALEEAALADRFRFERRDEGFDADTLEYRASFGSSAEYRELETAWKGLQPAVALFARNAGVRLEARLEPYAFVVVAPKATPEFPSGEAVELEHVLARYEPVLRRHPLRFVLGIDQRGEPLFVELGTETPHLLVAGGTGSGKSRAVFAALVQLLVASPPERLGLWLLDSVKRELTSLFGDSPHLERQVVAEDGAAVVATLAAFTDAMDARYRDLAGREFDPSRGRSHLLVIEEWADLRDLLERAELEEVVRSVNRVGQIGRGAGFHLVLVTQKASAEVIPPRLKTNFKGRVAGYFAQASDYAILFDQHRRLLPNVKGRLAVSLGGDDVVIVQGLFADNDTIRRRVRGLAAARTAIAPAPQVPEPPDELMPRRPSPGEIELLGALTVARVLFRWEAAAGSPIVVSVRSVAEHLRGLDLSPGRTERLTAVLAELEAYGVLERTGESANAPRRLALDWPESRRRLGLSAAI
jgi:S-DNA-T family DNA segregation ATPase FtsK/SpoIIIE